MNFPKALLTMSEQVERDFTYYQPTVETRALYAKIELAELDCCNALMVFMAEKPCQQVFEGITAATKAFALVLVDCCPPSADLSAALRCVRIARMAAGEQVVDNGIVVSNSYIIGADQMVHVAIQLQSARHQANASISIYHGNKPAEVIGKVCKVCGAPENDHPYRHPFVSF